MNKKLRLLITPDCNRNCPQCCNLEFDLDALPVIEQATDFDQYNEIAFTGGEPLLYPDKVFETYMYIREYGDFKGKLYIYTAMPGSVAFRQVVRWFDNVTVTIHDKEALADLFEVHWWSVALMVNKCGIKLAPGVHRYEKPLVRLGYHVETFTWIEDCPLPEGEDFKRI